MLVWLIENYTYLYKLNKLTSVKFTDTPTGTQGFIARDDTRKEIVVSFRGTFQLQDFDTGN